MSPFAVFPDFLSLREPGREGLGAPSLRFVQVALEQAVAPAARMQILVQGPGAAATRIPPPRPTFRPWSTRRRAAAKRARITRTTSITPGRASSPATKSRSACAARPNRASASARASASTLRSSSTEVVGSLSIKIGRCENDLQPQVHPIGIELRGRTMTPGVLRNDSLAGRGARPGALGRVGAVAPDDVVCRHRGVSPASATLSAASRADWRASSHASPHAGAVRGPEAGAHARPFSRSPRRRPHS